MKYFIQSLLFLVCINAATIHAADYQAAVDIAAQREEETVQSIDRVYTNASAFIKSFRMDSPLHQGSFKIYLRLGDENQAFGVVNPHAGGLGVYFYVLENLAAVEQVIRPILAILDEELRAQPILSGFEFGFDVAPKQLRFVVKKSSDQYWANIVLPTEGVLREVIAGRKQTWFYEDSLTTQFRLRLRDALSYSKEW